MQGARQTLAQEIKVKWETETFCRTVGLVPLEVNILTKELEDTKGHNNQVNEQFCTNTNFNKFALKKIFWEIRI